MNTLSLRMHRAVRRLERATTAMMLAKDKPLSEQIFVLEQWRRAKRNYARIRQDVDSVLEAAYATTTVGN